MSYCAIATLSFLGYLPDPTSQNPKLASPGTQEFERLVRWLVGMQTTEIYDKDDSEEEGDQLSARGRPTDAAHETSTSASENPTPSLLPEISALGTEDLQWAGFNGRCNKLADTCYCFWVTGTLEVTILVKVLFWLFTLIASRFYVEYILLKRKPTVDISSKKPST